MATIPVRPETATGVSELVVVPLPSWPLVPSPQASTVPVDVSAKPWSAPPAMATMPERPDTVTGEVGVGGGAVAQLTIGAVAPGLDGAGGGEGIAGVGAGRHLGHPSRGSALRPGWSRP